jgi:NTE family protein
MTAIALDAEAPPAVRPRREEPVTALILSGGGARAAYQVGVLRAIVDARPAGAPLPFRVVCGNSAGALNAAFLAADAAHFGRAVMTLDQLWTSLSPAAIYRTESGVLLAAALRMVRAFFRGAADPSQRPAALLDSAPLASLLARTVDFAGIAASLEARAIHALAITAFCYTTVRSVTFCQTLADIPMWARAQRRGVIETIGPSHLLASTAIPFIFPAVRIGDAYYGDGSMRQVAPTSPALHLGATKIFVVGVTRSSAELRNGTAPGHVPTLAGIGAQMLANMFADVMASDLERVRLVNAAVRQIPAPAIATSPVPLRDVGLYSISPSVSLEAFAREHVQQLPPALRRAFGGARGNGGGAGLASYLLFAGEFCRELIELGRRDAIQRMDEITAFLDA